MPRLTRAQDEWDDDHDEDEGPAELDFSEDDDDLCIPCPYCGRQILEESERCPYCCAFYLEGRCSIGPETDLVPDRNRRVLVCRLPMDRLRLIVTNRRLADTGGFNARSSSDRAARHISIRSRGLFEIASAAICPRSLMSSAFVITKFDLAGINVLRSISLPFL